MQIRSKTLMVAAGGGLLLATAWWGVVETLTTPRFLALEQREARSHLARLKELLQQQTAALLDKSGDWGLWDDAFRFAQDGNQGFRDANLIPTTSQSMRLHQVAYLSFDGQLIGTGTCDLTTGQALTDPPLAHLDTTPSGIILATARRGLKGAGFVTSPQGPLLIAFQPVRKSDGSGTPTAAVVFLRKIDDDKIREWSELLQLPLRWGLPQKHPDIELLSPTTLQVHHQVLDISERPLACVSLTVGRDIAQVGGQGVRDLLIGGLAVAGLLTVLMALALEGIVLRRLSRLARQVSSLDAHGTVTIDGHDELTALAKGISDAVGRATSFAATATLEQRRFTALFQRSGDAILIIEEGRVLEANRAAMVLLGHGVVGQRYDTLLPPLDGTRSVVRSHHSPTSPARELFAHPVHGGAAIPVEVREALIGVDGHDYVAVMLRDLRAQRDAEAELRLLASVTDSTSDLLLVLTVTGTPHTTNAALRRQLPVPGDTAWAPGIFAPDVRDAMVQHLQSATTTSWRGETMLLGPTPVPVSALAFPIQDARGVTSHVALVMRDIHLEREREEALQHARQEAERAAQAKASFLAVMSHELRTPLNGVIGMSSLLARTTMTPVQNDYLRTITDCAESLLTQINDVLDLSRLDSDAFTLESLRMDVRQVAEEALGICAPRASDKGLEIGLIAPPMADRCGDPVRVRQMLINLIGNAVKFTERGGVALRLGSDAHGALTMTVEDTGIGMAPDVLGKLFTPFVQADSTMTRRFGGSGLGLAISQRLAQRMGGSITVTSQSGHGSVFTITLPLPVEGEARPPLALLGRRFLVMDPRPIPLEATAAILEASGAIVRRATEPTEPQAGELLLAPLDIASCADLLQRHGGLGTLPLGSTLPAPTGVMTISRPLRLTALHDALTSMAPAPAPTLAPVVTDAPVRVLVVEDNPTNRLMVRSMLELLGAECMEAEHGAEALERLTNDRFDIVLMDGQMPVMDGFEAVRRWRALETLHNRPRTPIIALTALALPGDDARCRTAGMDDYLTKPFTIDRLDRILKRWTTAIG